MYKHKTYTMKNYISAIPSGTNQYYYNFELIMKSKLTFKKITTEVHDYATCHNMKIYVIQLCTCIHAHALTHAHTHAH